MNRFKLWYAFRNAVLLTAGMGLMTSCAASFFPSEQTVMIEAITTTVDTNGDLIITITFTGDAKEPISFTIPQGQTGNGIDEVTQVPSGDGTKTVVTITYTDPGMEPTVFEVTNGVSVVSIASVPNPEEPLEMIVNVTLSNGEVLTFTISRPQDGKDGNSITGIDYEQNLDGSVTVTIHFSDMEDAFVEIPAGRKGNDGVSVTSITMVPNADESKYIITFNMSNGTIQRLEMDRPTRWHSGYGAPSNSLGIPGDFYYDLENDVVYRATTDAANKWVIQLSFKDDIPDKYVKVKFNTNTSKAPWASWGTHTFPNDLNEPYYMIPEGRHFYSQNIDIPVPLREGYRFEGWYTHSVYNPNLTRFTNLIPVYGTNVSEEMTLYAYWVLIE